jgi:hypothetical protein
MDEIEIEEPFCRRPFRWTLHQLAMALAETNPRDPAALAFAGLGPTAGPPSPDESALSDEEQRRLAWFGERVVERLRQRLTAPNPSAATAATAGRDFRKMAPRLLRDWICRRRARVVADPGWIEAHFSLDEVSTEIRRAGLDLDPGYVPWLGVVLKYVYE